MTDFGNPGNPAGISQIGQDQQTPNVFSKYRRIAGIYWQKFLDDSSPWLKTRWLVTTLLVLLYFLRIYLVGGWYIVTYALGIYILNLLIGFLSPQVDPEFDEDSNSLPLKTNDEFKPFVRRLPEFKFW